MIERKLLVGLILVASVLSAHSLGEGADFDQSEPTPSTEPSSSPVDSSSSAPTTQAASTTPTTTTTTTQATTAATKSSSTTTTTAKPAPKNNPNCPQVCACTQTHMDCSGRQLTQVPKLELKNSDIVEFDFTNNSLSSIDFKQFPLATIKRLELDNNKIRSIVPPTKKQNELSKLRSLSLSKNKLDSLDNFGLWKMPVLNYLDLSNNPLERINASDFANKPLIVHLHLNESTKLKSLDELAFYQLKNLETLNLSQSVRTDLHLPDQLFAKNQALQLLDLSYNKLIEVPVAIRSTNSIKTLILDGNSMTSLRQSDFINQTSLVNLQISHCNQLLRIDPYTFSTPVQLKNLIMTNNERLHEISLQSFERQQGKPAELAFLDLSNNNLTSLPSEMGQLKVSEHIRLSNNPWDCTCSLKWLAASNLTGDQLIHCATPANYKDMELVYVLSMTDCQVEESIMQRFVLVIFLMFLIVLTVAVFAQRADICRRLQWRDQYGTIYYTKASFPVEQV
jgi:Leucine-rich repeat (LRR) protein